MTLDDLLRWAAWFLLASWAFFALRIGLYTAKLPARERARALRGILLGLVTVAIGWSFIGIVFLSIGLGVIFPTITMIGAPLSCPAPGQFELFSQGYSYKPGQHGTVREFYCRLPGGERETVTFLTLLYAGLIYSALLTTLTMWAGRFGLRILVLKPAAPGPSDRRPGATARPSTSARSSRTGSLESRLRDLKALHEAGLIDDGTYQARQLEILRDP
ncbi:hypothetical protein CDEN61S_02364 [Castellaniella denitrificans]